MTLPPTTIPGYAHGSRTLPRAPLALEELDRIKQTVLLGPADEAALRQCGPILAPRVETILDEWYTLIGSQPHLIAAFVDKRSGEPDEEYLAAVRQRFGQWILDTCAGTHDQTWLDWQMEIGRRHHRTGKNRTDHAEAADHVPLRYLLALVSPIALTIRPHLEASGRPRAEVDAMHEAWRKAVLLQAILWSFPYAKDGDY